MAEIVGVVASGIAIGTLAVKVLESSAELKGFWDNIQEAPSDIADLLQEANLIGEIILGLENETELSSFLNFGPEHEKLAADCLQHCYAASEKLRLLVEDLALDINKKKGYRRYIASAKVVLKKDQVKKYRSRLKGAIRLLSLSEQCYSKAYQRCIYSIVSHALTSGSRRPSLPLYEPSLQAICSDSSLAVGGPSLHEIRRESNVSPDNQHLIQASDIDITAPSTAFNWFRYLCGEAAYTKYYVSSRNARNKSKNKQHLKYAMLQYRMPGWLANQVWIASGYANPNFSDFRMRIYNVIPESSTIFNFIEAGNIEAIKTLFKKKASSPFDRDEFGWTLLHHAVWCGDLAIMQLLIENGANTIEPDFEMITPLDQLISLGKLFSFHLTTPLPVTDMLRLFVNAGECDWSGLDEKLRPGKSIFSGPTSSLSLLLDALMQFRGEITLLERQRLALRLALYRGHNTPILIRTALGHYPFKSLALELEDEDGDTLMSALIYSLWILVGELRQISEFPGPDIKWVDPIISAAGSNTSVVNISVPHWILLIRDLAAAGADLHHCVTGYSRFLTACERRCSRKDWLHKKELHYLLQLLADAGIDLTKFGIAEAIILRRLKLEGGTRKCYNPLPVARVIGFSYGAQPSDWEFWFEEPTDKFAGQFWHMIENPELKMPGAWIADDNGRDDDSDVDNY